jgi:hypothetical protein
MNTKNWIVLVVCVALFTTPVAFAQTTATTTEVQFIIGTVVQFTLTLLGLSPVASNSTGYPTAAIVFNSTTGTTAAANPYANGGSTQNPGAGQPIFSYDNTGTVNLNISVKLNATTPTCINLYGGTTNTTITTAISTSPVSVVNSFTPAASAQDYYLQTNFSGCTSGDTTNRLLTSNGTQS